MGAAEECSQAQPMFYTLTEIERAHHSTTLSLILSSPPNAPSLAVPPAEFRILFHSHV